MTVVFVHGVPETPSLWNSLRERMDRPTLALRLPGFGSPRPAGLVDKEAYAAWLADELRAIGGPVDLVGHDWGAHLTMRVVSAYDVPVRSWVSDVAHGWHPDYRWHEAALLFQQSPQGEELLASLRAGSPDSPSFGDFLRPRGMSAELAEEVDTVHDEVMSASVLALYRSARPTLHADWGREFDGPSAAPGLVLIPNGDPMARPAMDREVAHRLGARATELDGLTHYWMLQDPDRGAEALNRFWAACGAR